jgi:hypothetical protein
MTGSMKRCTWILIWALLLGWVLSSAFRGHVAADDNNGDDDQVPAIVITEPQGSTQVTEGGPGAHYTIALTEAPVAAVTITLSPDDEVTVEPAVVVFAVDSWDEPQIVTVTAVDDDVAEGAHTGRVGHTVTSADERYEGLAVPEVVVAITDNDTPGVRIEPTSLSILEGGPPGSYRVRLTSRPGASVVVVPHSRGDGLELAPHQLTFDAAHWDDWQTVAVSVDDDAVAMGPRTGVIAYRAESDDPTYDGLAITDVHVSLSDDDVAGVTVAPTTVHVEEGGATDTYGVTLESQPLADVTIRVSSDGQTRTTPTLLSFAPSDWNQTQQVTVTAEDDLVEEGDHESVIEHSVESADPAYDGLAVQAVTAVIADRRPPGVRIRESVGSTRVTEGGPSDSYTIALRSMPLSNVVITIDADSEVTVQPSAITFRPWDWDEEVTVTVWAVDDDVAEGAHTSTLRHTASSNDPRYQGIEIADVVVSITDNDAAGVRVSPTSVQVAEGGATATYQVVLESRPTADVTVRIVTDDQARTQPTTLIFGPATWSTSRSVTVTAEDDGVVEGDHQSTIRHIVESNDGVYDGIEVAAVTVAITDRTTPAGVHIVETGSATHVTEGGAGDTYTVVLASRPQAAATIHITTDAQTTVAPSQLVFTSGNWRDARVVAVSAVDDRRAEGDHASTIRHRSTSADPAYDGISIRDVVAFITDNDRAGVSISTHHIDMVEGDDGAGYTLALESEPATEVLVRVSTDGLTVASPSEVRFTPTDWQTPRWVSIAVDDDANPQGTRVSTVRHSVESGDVHYQAVSVDAVSVTVYDNDRADVIVSSRVEPITTPDGSTSFSVRLTSRPRGDVVIPLHISSDLCRLDLDAVRLTRDTWQEGVQVMVSANVGAFWRGEAQVIIALGPTSSSDPHYDGRDPEDVVVTLRIERSTQDVWMPLAVRLWPPLPAAPALRAVDNPQGLGDYSVSWDAADGADSYVLEEATDASFADGQELYAGPGTTQAVSGRGPGRYYYRVAATNAWGQSAWSAAVVVDVLWEREPNDTATEANGPLLDGITYCGALAVGDVQDYYRLAMGAAGRIEVWLDGIPAGQNYDLVVRDAALQLVGYSAELGDASEHARTETLPAGTYYIQVYQRSGGGSPEPYALRFSVR